MPKLEHVAAIEGVRIQGQRSLNPVATCWDFQTTGGFSSRSAEHLLNALPEDCELSFFDPEAQGEESWLCVRRVGPKFFLRQVGHGVRGAWSECLQSAVVASFMASPLVRHPAEGLSSFEVSTIPEHQRYDHVGELDVVPNA